ncbi:hypothetical protein LXN10_01405 [Arcobacter sp. KX21116]
MIKLSLSPDPFFFDDGFNYGLNDDTSYNVKNIGSISSAKGGRGLYL